MSKFTYILGVDEAGRGPLAGPVAVGVVCVSADFDWSLIPGVDDSKKLTEKKREVLFALAEKLQKEKKLQYAVCMVSAKIIDEIGIVRAIQKAMNTALAKIQRSGLCTVGECLVKLDGSLKAPSEYIHQETIIGGDGKEKVIGLASVIAKVTRDRYMVTASTNTAYSCYFFDLHKGYGTKVHTDAILQFGICDIHRKSFCRSLVK